MKDLTASDLASVARDLLTGAKRELLQQLIAAPLFVPSLQELARSLEDVPTPKAPAAAPLAAELDEADDRHDGFGYAVWHQLESYRRAPSVSAETRAAAQLLRETFVPALAELSASYLDEAAQARTRRKLLDTHAEALRSFPVAGGATLYDWVVGRLDAGDELDTLIKARAEVMGQSNGRVGTIRGQGIGLLYRLRGSLVDERARNPDLPEDLEQRLFAYADLVQATRSRGSRAAVPVPEEAPKPEATPTPDEGEPAPG